MGEIARRIAMLPKENGSTSRLVIITQGSEPVIAEEHGKIKKFPIEPLAKDAIVDTNGAGDAFVGGFLAQYVLGKSPFPFFFLMFHHPPILKNCIYVLHTSVHT